LPFAPRHVGQQERSAAGRWIAVLSILAGVCLIGAGIARILRSDYVASMGIAGAFIAPAEIFAGTVLLFIPLYLRLSRDSKIDNGNTE
jgi:hypothetical protein